MLRKAVAMSAVGDREATAMSIPFSLSANSMPFAWGYREGVSRFDRHSLKVKGGNFNLQSEDYAW